MRARRKQQKQEASEHEERIGIAAALIVMLTGVSGAQDVQKGENSFKKCLPCHSVGPDAKNKIGPELNGLDGRKAGTVPTTAIPMLIRIRASPG